MSCEIFFLEFREVRLVTAVRVKVTEIGIVTHLISVVGVVSMLKLHAGILAKVYIISPVFLCCKILLDPHVHIEGLVSLGLAVFNALFLIGGGLSELELNTVLVALVEEDVREG